MLYLSLLLSALLLMPFSSSLDMYCSSPPDTTGCDQLPNHDCTLQGQYLGCALVGNQCALKPECTVNRQTCGWKSITLHAATQYLPGCVLGDYEQCEFQRQRAFEALDLMTVCGANSTVLPLKTPLSPPPTDPNNELLPTFHVNALEGRDSPQRSGMEPELPFQTVHYALQRSRQFLTKRRRILLHTGRHRILQTLELNELDSNLVLAGEKHSILSGSQEFTPEWTPTHQPNILRTKISKRLAQVLGPLSSFFVNGRPQIRARFPNLQHAKQRKYTTWGLKDWKPRPIPTNVLTNRFSLTMMPGRYGKYYSAWGGRCSGQFTPPAGYFCEPLNEAQGGCPYSIPYKVTLAKELADPLQARTWRNETNPVGCVVVVCFYRAHPNKVLFHVFHPYKWGLWTFDLTKQTNNSLPLPLSQQTSWVDLNSWQTLFKAFQGDQWVDCSLSYYDPCSACQTSQHFVTCQLNPQSGLLEITEIVLPQNRLNGSLDSFREFPQLVRLDLSNTHHDDDDTANALTSSSFCFACSHLASCSLASVPLCTFQPSARPTQSPTKSPSQSPFYSQQPTMGPILSHPTLSPSVLNTPYPTVTEKPTTSFPTVLPTSSFPTTLFPTIRPTSMRPSKSPTTTPTRPTTRSPTFAPSHSPTWSPSLSPTVSSPTASPTTSSPTLSPTVQPTMFPSKAPRMPKTKKPTSTTSPSLPTLQPTLVPTTLFPTSTVKPTTQFPTSTVRPTTQFPTSTRRPTVTRFPTTSSFPTTSPTSSPTTNTPTSSPFPMMDDEASTPVPTKRTRPKRRRLVDINATEDVEPSGANAGFELLLQRGGFQEARGDCGSGGGKEWFVENSLTLLDSPGEYWLDLTNLYLYWYPFPNQTMTPNDLYELTSLRTLVRIEHAHDVLVEGIVLEHTYQTHMDDDAHEMVSGGDWTVTRSGALFMENVYSIRVERNIFRSLGGNGLFLSKSVFHVGVELNDFYAIDSSSIMVVGDPLFEDAFPFDRRNGRHHVDTVLIARNVMSDLGAVVKQSSGVFLAIAKSVRVESNVMFDCARAGLTMNDAFGGNTTVVGNVFFHTVLETLDHGPINVWDRQQWMEPPNKINFAFTNNLLLGNLAGPKGVDLDDGVRFMDVTKNVILDGIVKLKGNDLLYDENLFFPNDLGCYLMTPFNLNSGSNVVVRNNTCISTIPNAFPAFYFNVATAEAVRICERSNLLMDENKYYGMPPTWRGCGKPTPMTWAGWTSNAYKQDAKSVYSSTRPSIAEQERMILQWLPWIVV